MKKIITLLLTGISLTPAIAQDSATVKKAPVTGSVSQDPDIIDNDKLLQRWCLNVNGMMALWNKQKTPNGYTIFNESAYPGISKDPNRKGVPVFSPSLAIGTNVNADIQLDYFFSESRRFGVGIGVMYSQFTGTAKMDSFHAEYQSTDIYNRTFRQILSGNNIAENITYTSWNIPLMLKFKHEFNRKNFGIYMNAGGVFSVSSTNTVSANNKFDYEAVYQYNGSNTVYESNVNPSSNDLLLTKAFYMNSNNHDANAAVSAFDKLATEGYNVGLGKGNIVNTTHHYNFGAGYLVQAGFSYQLSYKLTFDLGGYFMQQWFMNNNASDYKITDKVNTYNTMLNSTKNISNASAGFTVGVRYFLGRDQDRDGDGIPDRKDNCPTKIGLKQFCGCPDSDKDGIPDNEDRCPLDAGPECTGGCPDKDGDCVADIEDQCPTVFGTEDSGCPFVDKDGDGVPDKEDRCPDVRGSKDNFGCPVSYNTGSPEVQHVVDTTFIPPHVQLSVKTVNFKSGQSAITKQVEAELDEAAETMMKYPNVMLLISGYTDNIGSYEGNMELSFKRGEAIKKYLRDKGIAPERMKVSGYGKLDPKAKNDTPENRANNRRVELELALPL